MSESEITSISPKMFNENEQQIETPSESEETEDEELIIMELCPYAICFFTEFFAMAAQTFVGCLGAVYRFNIGPVIESVSFGLGRVACLEMFSHISPIHVNPAKSLGFFILGRMHLKRFGIYVVAQYIGSIAGIAYVMAVIPSNVDHVCLNQIERGLKPTSALALEFITTMILMLAVASATDPVNEKKKDSLNLRIGIIVIALVMSLEIFTGAGKNPARSFSPALLQNKWQDYWLFQVGPYCGAASGAIIYRYIFSVHERYSLHSVLAKLHRKKHF